MQLDLANKSNHIKHDFTWTVKVHFLILLIVPSLCAESASATDCCSSCSTSSCHKSHDLKCSKHSDFSDGVKSEKFQTHREHTINYPLYKVYMGLIFKGYHPKGQIPPFSLWQTHLGARELRTQSFSKRSCLCVQSFTCDPAVIHPKHQPHACKDLNLKRNTSFWGSDFKKSASSIILMLPDSCLFMKLNQLCMTFMSLQGS